MKISGSSRRGVALLVGACSLSLFGLVLVAAPAAAGPASEYGSFALSPNSLSFAGTFPAATFVSQRSLAVSASAVLSAATPFGAVFGDSTGENYLRMSSPTNSGSSSTTLTFAADTPATGLGFALGDVDSESITVTATTTGGAPVTVAELGWQGAFNYLNGSDIPTWNAGTSTLVGNVADTQGASGWFQPTVPLSGITFTNTTLIGSPEAQLWMAAPLNLPPTPTPTASAETAVPAAPATLANTGADYRGTTGIVLLAIAIGATLIFRSRRFSNS